MESNLRTEKKLRKQHKMLKIEGALRRSDTTFDNISFFSEQDAMLVPKGPASKRLPIL